MAIKDWYKILGVSEDVTNDELDNLRATAQREHHPDRYKAEPEAVQAQHAAQLKICLEGTAFLLSANGPRVLKEYLQQQRILDAMAKIEERRKLNEQEARQRGDADDLRTQFGRRHTFIGEVPPMPSNPSWQSSSTRQEEWRNRPTGIRTVASNQATSASAHQPSQPHRQGTTGATPTSPFWHTIPASSPPHQSVTPPRPNRPPTRFDFWGWVGSCIMSSLFMLIPDIWISVWIRAIVIGGSAGFNFKFYLILSGVLGVILATIMSLREL